MEISQFHKLLGLFQHILLYLPEHYYYLGLKLQ